MPFQRLSSDLSSLVGSKPTGLVPTVGGRGSAKRD